MCEHRIRAKGRQMQGAVVKIGPRHLMATWVRRQHTEPLNEKNERLSAPLLRTHLHAVGFHYGRRVRQELQDSIETPFLRTSLDPPIRPTRLIGSLVRWTPDSSCFKVWPLFLLLLLISLLLLLLHRLPSSTAPSLGSLQKEPVIGSAWNSAFTPWYNYCTACAPKSISRED